MPLFPGHPTFEVVSYRTPHGSRVTDDHHWGLPNDACLGFMSELVMGTTHSGAHIDAHAHMTVGEDDRWYGGSGPPPPRALRPPPRGARGSPPPPRPGGAGGGPGLPRGGAPGGGRAGAARGGAAVG